MFVFAGAAGCFVPAAVGFVTGCAATVFTGGRGEGTRTAPVPWPNRSPSSQKRTTGTKATVTATVTSADGSPPGIWNRNGKNWQKGDVRSDGTIRSMGLCMDVAWGASRNGAVIQLAVCSGNPAQRFRLNSGNGLVNPQADKRVDVKDEQTGNGTRLQLLDCNGQDNQKWSTR
ncbi:ricin-type beta-trefoil lectin domain protein [Streptomyces fuscichromogenes]|uniref:ricin-type beta-trefoil lectin domain protein n=1 Tax=Streptomyces fuscichromogenes TaxID=1324013 RepID=UPI00382F9DEA